MDSWGYDLIGTPCVELLSTVALGVQPEQVQRLFKFSDADGQMLALVGERTVSAARVATGPMLSAGRPLRLCYLGPTFQGTPPGGVRREAYQAGAELIGTHSAAADAEVVAMAIRALEACGLDDFQVEIGHVGFFGGLMSRLEERERELVRDALVGRDLVELEEALAATDLRAQEQELLLRFPALRGGEEILQAARSLVDNPGSAEAIDELQAVYRLLGAHGVEGRVNLDLGAVRDFDYYTGLIFEVFAPGLGAPLAAGGRYDGLLRRFGADEPATGLVVFLDRVQQLLEGHAGGNGPSASVLVGFSDDAAAAIRESVRRRGGGARVVMAVDACSAEELERRRDALGAESAVLADGSEGAT
jgi:ATP phosphoribosyltransferase regulatory subunit